MKIQTDILGNTPEIGDIIVYNPPKYKGLRAYKCVGFSSGGLPQVLLKDGSTLYTPRTGFVCIKIKSKKND